MMVQIVYVRTLAGLEEYDNSALKGSKDPQSIQRGDDAMADSRCVGDVKYSDSVSSTSVVVFGNVMSVID